MDDGSRRVEVEFIADFVCPWCYLGWRRLEQAAKERPAIRVDIRWSPFLLNPHLPAEGMDRRDYLRIKFGGEAAARRVYERIGEAGESTGIHFRFERMGRTPNTVQAQRLILWADDRGEAEPLIERLFRALFEEGRDIGSREELLDQVAAAGLDRVAAARFLAGEEHLDDVLRAHVAAERRGVRGIPVFVVDRRQGINGAQPPEVLAALLDLAGVDPPQRSPARTA
jgi:predicted DsbA family dithiol-disulfide isomerase